MCFTANLSIATFITGIATSILLIHYGNETYKKENVIIGLFLIFVTFMQVFEYIFWKDTRNKYGYNHLTTIIAPLFNHLQPIVLFILLCVVYHKFNIYFVGLNVIYFIYVIVKYIDFVIHEKNLVTNVQNGHLYWKWKDDFNYHFYFMILLFNIFMYLPTNYAFMFIALGLMTFFYSKKFFKNNFGELWCYYTAYLPMVILIFTYLIEFF